MIIGCPALPLRFLREHKFCSLGIVTPMAKLRRFKSQKESFLQLLAQLVRQPR